MTLLQTVEDIFLENSAHVETSNYQGSAYYKLRQYKVGLCRDITLSTYNPNVRMDSDPSKWDLPPTHATLSVSIRKPYWNWNLSRSDHKLVSGTKMDIDPESAVEVVEALMESKNEASARKALDILQTDGWSNDPSPEYLGACAKPTIVSEPVETPKRKWWPFNS